jgi:diguanylate cyclase (GGDEF)-like protein
MKRLKRMFFRIQDSGATQEREHWSGLLAIAPDYLAQIQEEFGSEARETVLVALATYLQNSLRETDIVTRAPDDAFVLFLPNLGFAALTGLTQKLLGKIRELRIDIQDGKKIGCTCSMGYCLFPYHQSEGYTWEDVVRLARIAVTLAQKCGRDKAVGLDYVADLPFQEALAQLQDGPRRAVERGVFVAQPLS